jgi:hypothetical protein
MKRTLARASGLPSAADSPPPSKSVWFVANVDVVNGRSCAVHDEDAAAVAQDGFGRRDDAVLKREVSDLERSVNDLTADQQRTIGQPGGADHGVRRISPESDQRNGSLEEETLVARASANEDPIPIAGAVDAVLNRRSTVNAELEVRSASVGSENK